MSEPRETPNTVQAKPTTSARERFLKDVEAKTLDPIHRRLLTACRQSDAVTAIETELRAVVDEIIRED